MELDGAGPLRRQRLLAAGWTDDEVRSRVRSGELLALRRGAYLRDGERPRDAEAWHAVTIRAALPDLAPQVVISHASAVVLHGLPVWGFGLERITATRARRSGARRTTGLHLHAAPLEAAEITSAEGVPVTSVARTVVDMGRSVPFEQAVVLADAALHRELTTPDELLEALQTAAGRPGCPRARRAIGFADGRSESVGESRSRVAMLRAGLPAPVLQWPLSNRAGRQLGRVDFWWPQLRTVGEFDGRVKYGRLLEPGTAPGDAVFGEKVREDRIRDEDVRVVRWIWSEIAPFDDVARRLSRAFGWS